MANYAIMRIEKRKLPSVGRINKHHERQKEEYKSNPDIDRERTGLNYHIVQPPGPYREAALARIEQAGARRRKDSVVLQDCFVGGTPDWLKAKSQEEQRAYFSHAYQFFEDNFGKENIISAVVHMDVKYSIVLIVYGVYRVREKLKIGTTYTNRKKNVYDVTWKRIRKILKSGIGSGSFFMP